MFPQIAFSALASLASGALASLVTYVWATHSKDLKARRVQLQRELAALSEDEIRLRKLVDEAAAKEFPALVDR